VARRRGKGKISAEINVTPMADIMLVLLIIFMIATPLMQTGITVNLPNAKYALEAKDSTKEDAVVIAVNREAKIYWQKTQISDAELYDTLIRKYSSGEINREIYLKADSAVGYGRVVDVVNICRKAGVERIGLMAEKDEN